MLGAAFVSNRNYSTGRHVFKHGLPFSKHVRACRHVILGPAASRPPPPLLMPGNATITRRNNCNFEFEFLGPTALSGIFYDATVISVCAAQECMTHKTSLIWIELVLPEFSKG